MGKKIPFRKKTIFKRLLIPLMAVMLVQAVLYSTIFLHGGILNQINNNTLDILNERVINRTQDVENEMVQRWSNLDQCEAEILSIIETTLAAEGASPAQIVQDARLNERIVSEAVPQLIYLLRRNAVTGAFLVLDGKGIEGETAQRSNAGFYIRDLDPVSYSEGNGDLLAERGMPAIAKKMDIPLDTEWHAAFRFSQAGDQDAEQFYFKPLRAARASENKESKNFGYWSRRFSLGETDGAVITYSIPLILQDGSVVGVLGIDLTESYLQSQLRYDEIIGEKAGTYVLAIANGTDRSSFERVCSNGPAYKLHFGESSSLSTTKQEYSDIYRFVSPNNAKEVLFGSVQPLQLYNRNTPFEQDQWVLIGIVDRTHLWSFSYRTKTMVYICTLIALLLGVVGVLIASSLITKPITKLVSNLKRSDPNKAISLEKINIEEIDELTVSIENLSNAVAESASKMSRIIAMANIAVGVFEFKKNADKVFCSEGIFDILHWHPINEESGYVEKEEFQKHMDRMQRYKQDQQALIYRIPQGEQRFAWVQMTYLEEEEAVLGVLQDITKDMVEKQKIEFERDYDVLTNLYNRRAFLQKLSVLFEQKQLLGVAALIMWDLDNLKYINDTYGHDYGDRYIQALGECLVQFSGVQGIVARRSGDEFYVFVYGHKSKEEIRALTRQVWSIIEGKTLAAPNGGVLKIRVSAGIAWYPDDGKTSEDLIRYADFAMYTVKHSAKGYIQEFDHNSYEHNSLLVNGPEALNRLVEQQLVRYAFQPIVSADNGSVYGYEMLMRPTVDEFAFPHDVLRVARSQSKLYQIEKLTWNMCLKVFRSYQEAGKISEQAKIFINSIGSYIMNEADVQQLEDQYSEYLKRVVLEITESEPGIEEYSPKKVQIAKRWGAQVALDDYGSGYNSESVLIFLSPDLVKVDMSIIQGIDKDVDRQNMLDHLISYARSRGIKVLAEGVETQAEMQTVIARGVDYLQGYYIGKPAFEITPIPERVIKEIRQAANEETKR